MQTIELLGMSEHGGVGWQVLGEITPVVTVLQWIEDAAQDLLFCPPGQSWLLLLGQQGFNDFPPFVKWVL